MDPIARGRVGVHIEPQRRGRSHWRKGFSGQQLADGPPVFSPLCPCCPGPPCRACREAWSQTCWAHASFWMGRAALHQPPPASDQPCDTRQQTDVSHSASSHLQTEENIPCSPCWPMSRDYGPNQQSMSESPPLNYRSVVDLASPISLFLKG